MIDSVNHVSFTVSNLEDSVNFYRDVFGLECISLAERDEEFSSRVTGISDVKMKIAYMSVSNCSIELIQYVSGEGQKIDSATNNPGSAHLCFNVSNYDEWIKKLTDYSVHFCGELCIVPAGPNKGKRVCYITDNDGNHIECIERSIEE